MSKVVIIGAGQAGLEAATHLRSQGFDGEITLIGSENVLPYQRPPLSKKYVLDHIFGFWTFPVVKIYSFSRGIRFSGQNRAIPASRGQKLRKTTLEKFYSLIR